MPFGGSQDRCRDEREVDAYARPTGEVFASVCARRWRMPHYGVVGTLCL
jgi:hypothetical protein